MMSSQAYQETEIYTSSPSRLVVMLYRGAIRFVTQSADAIRKKDLEAKRVAVDRALAVVQHLLSTLSHEHNAELAGNLSRLYAYVTEKILEGSMKLRTEPLDEVVRLMSTLAESWEEVARREETAAPLPVSLQSGGENRMSFRA